MHVAQMEFILSPLLGESPQAFNVSVRLSVRRQSRDVNCLNVIWRYMRGERVSPVYPLPPPGGESAGL